jgi:hypothetical protein
MAGACESDRNVGGLANLPAERPSIDPDTPEKRKTKAFDWAALVARSVHPLKVAIIECLLWVEEPLSAIEMTQMFDGDYPLDLVKYHVGRLAKQGAVEVTDERRIRGAREK